MPRTLILCGAYPADLSSGADLRFLNLCKQIASRNAAYVVCLGDIPEGIDPESHMGVRGFATLPEVPAAGQSMLRHLRISDRHFIRRSRPDYLAETQSTIADLIARWNIDVVVCLWPLVAEMVLPLALPKLVDCTDSRTLTFRRMLANRGDQMSLRERVGFHTRYLRLRRFERAIVREFERTMTISAADRDCLLEVSGAHPDKVVVIPNGVSDSALTLQSQPSERRRSVVFWGNLDFPPNWTAIDYFHREIFVPFLADAGIEWHIIGKGADAAINELAKHPLVHLHGFVEDLYAEISSHGAMVNPMVEGSGLKNKVLEAFACYLPVVSTSIGIDAVGAQADEHYLVADEPAAFAEAVMRCLDDADFAASQCEAARRFVEDHFEWNAIGARLDGILQEVAA